ncbi:hypothetical protein N7533_004901 [Penicillium manginii]|uniref:uncharacterized protein n=1 Tax=Penicillium manginii TaxID=203109 RepID=UPI0025473CCD|nr:uncharacterized protein N7533_004901 [Penicillium manginii]KAJ5755358.1 hypothetical protein N7533_004901 [Penicillium manginii]
MFMFKHDLRPAARQSSVFGGGAPATFFSALAPSSLTPTTFNRNPQPPQQSTTDPSNQTRRNAPNTTSHRAFLPSRSPANSLSALAIEERALRLRKQNIASFGSSWIRPAGCAKTMLGMKEEEAEREEALAAAQSQMGAIDEGIMEDDLGLTAEEEDEGMERDLDDEIPEAEGLIEEGEDLSGEDIDEEGYMERDLDDDIPEAYPEDDYDDSALYEEEVDEDFDNQPDLDADVPSADEGFQQSFMTGSEGASRDLDDDIPDAAEDGSEQEGEWQHTDTEDEDEGDEDGDENAEQQGSSLRPRMNGNFRTSTPNSRGGLPPPPPLLRRERETEAQRRFINRWSGGGDALDSSSIMFEEDDLRASVTSQSSRRSGFGRRFPRHVGGPRDSLN